MKKVYIFCFLLLAVVVGKAQLLSWTPNFIKETDAGVEIICDATKGNQGLLNYTTSDVYVHLGVITNYSTSSSDWKHAPFTWATTPAAAHAVSLGNNKWKFTFTTDLRTFFSMTDAAEHIKNIAILFRSGDGSKKLANSDGTDMYVPVYDAGLQCRIFQPFKQPKYVPVLETITKNVGDAIAIDARASTTSNLKIYFNGVVINSLNGTVITANPTISVPGNQRIIAEAELAGNIKRDTVDFFVSNPTTVQALPAGVIDGINYDANGSSVTLVLFAPLKSSSVVIGDFNNWTQTTAYQMKQTPDGQRFWLRIDGLTPGAEYGYQYVIDGTLKVADYNTEKVLDPNNDQYISSVTYPGLKPYPTGLTTGLVSVLQTNKPAYTWANNSFVRPEKKSMVIYEILLRDFVGNHDWSTLTDTLNYLKKLNVNAIHLMPFNEFEGNISWGYNPSFYFAPDKYYGTENNLRRFIDSAHGRGIAVIMDMVLNHAGSGSDYTQVPMVNMYWDGTNNRPAANSPWFNTVAPHTWLNFGYDFNQDAQPYKDFTDRVIEYWLTKYKLDGLRWDFTKGFSQRAAASDAASTAYDASRVAILKRIYNKMQAVSSGSYCILEHFCDNTEETELSNYGMMLWGNLNYNYNEASMGYVSTSNFQWVVPTQRGWSQPNLVGYAESHDEERLMYKNEQFGNSTQAPTYNVKSIPTGLARQGMVAAFFIPIPGPKMIWQFGELGYDYSINRCENGTIDNSCRTSPKPAVWGYLLDSYRMALFNIYSKLNKLKTAPAFASTFTGSDITYDLTGAFKWMKINGSNLKVMVIGNFDVVPQTASITFQNAGTWYNYLSGGTRIATGAAESITLQPGEYYVYTNVDANAILPLKLISFTGKRSTNSIDLTWNTTNEIGVKQFELERSFDANVFNKIATINATNTATGQTKYGYADLDGLATKSLATVYYRLKMVDKDGKASYSNTVAVQPLGNRVGLTIYPNPVADDVLYVRINNAAATKLVFTIQDASGRIYQTITSTNSNIITIPVHNLAAGFYLLKAEGSSGNSVERFIVK